MATGITDKDLNMLRNMRWTTAFSDKSNVQDSMRDQINRKATIVIEHLIQASDVSHTMQHWHSYRKWNERFFIECYEAYRNGRSETDPSVNWYHVMNIYSTPKKSPGAGDEGKLVVEEVMEKVKLSGCFYA